MLIKELYDIYNQDDFDNAPSDETEFRLANGEDGSYWVKLGKWYNWDNPYDEVLYFFARHTEDEYLEAVSCGTTQDDVYLIKFKRFNYDHTGMLTFQEGDWDDPWEIYKSDLDPSDSDSLGDVIKHIFEEVKIVTDTGVFDVFK